MTKHIYTFLALLAGALIAHFVGLETNFVFSAAVVGIIFGLLLPKYSIPAYCGSFVGMSSLEILPSGLFLIGAAVIAALIKIFLGPKIPKVGGKAGFIAFLSILIINLPFLLDKEIYKISSLEISTIFAVILVAIIGVNATFCVRKRLKIREKTKGLAKGNAVVGSAIIGLIAGVIRILFPQFAVLSEAIFAASFAGMSSFHIVKRRFAKSLVGLISGMVFLVATPFFQGFGGKLGTIAFVAMMIYLGLRKNKIG